MNATLKIVNIKGQTKEYSLDRMNVITGPNGSGKSTIMESIAIAIDGEHPTSGKTLSAICSIVTGDSGSIELKMEHSGREIHILREFTKTDDSASQKIYINGRTVLQAEAKEKINEFMGGGGIRKMSPYKFTQMSPRDRLIAIADLMPPRETKQEDIVKKDICFGSEEFTGQCRFSLGKTRDTLTPGEVDEVAAKARLVDHEYFKCAEEYFISQGNRSDLDYIDLLVDNNKKHINDTQADVNRLAKSIQTYQDKLGNYVIAYSVDGIDRELEIQKDLEIQKKSALSHNQKLEVMRNDLKKTKEGLGIDIKELGKEKKRLEKILSENSINALVPGDVGGYEQKIKYLNERIEKSVGADTDFDTLGAKVSALTKDILSYDSSIDEMSSKIDSDLREIDRLNDCIIADGEILHKLSGNTCPLCNGDIEDGKSRSPYKSRIAKNTTLRDTISTRKDEMTHVLKNDRDTVGSLKKQRLDLESKYVVAKANMMSATDISQARDNIAGYVAAIKACESRDAYKKAKSELDIITMKENSIKQLDDQINSSKPQEIVTEEELQNIAARTIELKEMRKSAMEIRTLNDLINTSQVEMKTLETKRTILKSIKAILLSCKEDSYWFIDDILSKIKDSVGYSAIMSNDVFGLDRKGISISDKVLSGGEKIMYSLSVLSGVMTLSNGVSIAEIEGSELDSVNILKAIEIAKSSSLSMVFIATHNNVPDVSGCNMIRL